MLNHEGRENMWVILQRLDEQWDDDCELKFVQNLPSPYSEFEITFLLYGKVDVSILYDRSSVDIGIKQDGEYQLLGDFTAQSVFRGRMGMKYENMKHTFEILDEVARGMIAQ